MVRSLSPQLHSEYEAVATKTVAAFFVASPTFSPTLDFGALITLNVRCGDMLEAVSVLTYTIPSQVEYFEGTEGSESFRNMISLCHYLKYMFQYQ